MQSGEFLGAWKVVVGDIGHGGEPKDPDKAYYAVLIKEDDRFRLYSRVGANGDCVFHQNLFYNVETDTLEDVQSEPGPDRCISFWDCRARGGRRNRIFAMRTERVIIPGGILPEELRPYYLPWEYKEENGKPILLSNSNGSWGAEEGGG